MRVILAGGGTGGHLFPGLAVAREFQQRDPMTEILFVGTIHGIEARVLPRERFKLETITIKGMKGRGWRGLLDTLYGLPAALFQSLAIIQRFKPHCIIGLGGYASGPVLIAAKLKGTRCAIMEQNVRPGFTNKMLSRWVDRVFTTYPESRSFFSRGHVLETGNPVRWRTLPEIRKDEKFTLLVFGGSAGANRINSAIVDALRNLTDLAPDLGVIHQTGDKDFAAIQQSYKLLPFKAEVWPFIEKMDEAYGRADLVLCRAGATTVAELTAFGKAAILVPYPYAIYDHQRCNAESLQKQGAAEIIFDHQLTGEKLASKIRSFLTDPSRIHRMESAARALGRPEAASRIVDECYALLNG